jgi:predicted nucleic acid-binding protein
LALKIVVNDANILIDLADIDLLDDLTKLNFELHTNDFIIAEIVNPIQRKKIQKIIDDTKLLVAPTKAEEYFEILKLQTKNLSFEDCSILFYTKKVNGTLLSGDGNLRKRAQLAGIDVKGIFFVFDQLVNNKIISFITAIEKLKLLQSINKRLPKEEIDKRIEIWGKSDKLKLP